MSEIRDVRKALTHLEHQADDLSALMYELLEDKDVDLSELMDEMNSWKIKR